MDEVSPPGEIMPVARVTAMQLTDLPAVDKLERESFSSPWSSKVYARELTNNPFSFYKVIRPTPAGAAQGLPPILAYGGCWVTDDEAHIMTVASHPRYRRRHLGEWLLLALLADAIERAARTVMLEVRVSNLAAIRLYASLGFVETGVRKGYYPATRQQPREDALLLTLNDLGQAATQDRLLARRRTAEELAQAGLRAG